MNLPEEATVDDVMNLHRRVEARREGDRDLPRQLQGRAAAVELGARVKEATLPAGARARAEAAAGRPQRVGRKFRVGDYEGYIHVGVYDDGSPGDIFVDIAKDGTTWQGLMNSLMYRRVDGPAVRRAAGGVRLEALRICASSRAA